jgi:hypothetical protein
MPTVPQKGEEFVEGPSALMALGDVFRENQGTALGAAIGHAGASAVVNTLAETGKPFLEMYNARSMGQFFAGAGPAMLAMAAPGMTAKKYPEWALKAIGEAGLKPGGEAAKISLGSKAGEWLKTLEDVKVKSVLSTAQARADIRTVGQEAEESLGRIRATLEPDSQKRAEMLGYTVETYRGSSKSTGPRQVREGEARPLPHQLGETEYYSTSDPKLAGRYAMQNFHPGIDDPGNPAIQKLLLNTSNYHVIDAEGAIWNDIQHKGLSAALKADKDGLIIHNVRDEPGSVSSSSGATTSSVYITFPDRMSTVRSAFAKFEPSKTKIADLLAVSTGGVVVGAAAQALHEATDE